MERRKVLGIVALIVAGSLALAGCSNNGNDTGANTNPSANGGGSSSDPIKAIVLGGVGAEGILHDNSTTSITAAKASVAAVNAAGGINGRQIELTVVDDTADPTVAVTKLREALNSVKPDFVMNSGPSTVAEAITPVLTQAKVISFNIGPTETTSDPKQSPYNFDLSPGVDDYLNSYVEEMKTRGYKSVAVLHGSSPLGELFGQTAEKVAKDAGFTVTGNESYDIKALDMTPQIETLKSGNPDVLILDAYGAPLGYVLQGIQKVGWDLPVLGNISVAATSIIATKAPDGVLGTDQVKKLTMQVFKSTKYDANDTKTNDAVKQMVAAGDIKSSLILAYNYDAVLLYKAAVESAGSLDADAVAKAMIDPKVQDAADTVIVPKYGFTADSHTPHTQPDAFLFIEPSELKNGQFQ